MTQQTSEKRDIRLIAIDIDGTVLDSKHELTPRVERALRAAMAQGVQIVFATGKTRSSNLKFLEQLGVSTPGIYLQGLALYDGDGKLRHQLTLDAALARQAITFAEDRGFHVAAYSGERIIARTYNEALERELTRHHELAPEIVGPLQNQLGTVAFNKVIMIGEPRAIKALRWQLNLQIGGAGRLLQAGIPEMLELLPPGASKGAMLKLLVKDLKIDMANVMAIGDAENDLEMIQFAGIGVAMGHAAQNVKDAADYVTGTNDEDGVAQAIERFVLDAPPAEPAPESSESAAATTASTATEAPSAAAANAAEAASVAGDAPKTETPEVPAQEAQS